MILYIVVQAAATAFPVPPAPPSHTVPQVGVASRGPAEVFIVDVTVQADRAVLFEGPLRVATTMPASVQHEQSEAPPTQCASQGYGSRTVSRLRLQLAPSPDLRDPARVMVSASWTRPVERSCPAPAASRTVQIGENVLLPIGIPVGIAGDAGLSVVLRRR